ncbi:serine/threonine-protein kinase [Nocardioides taihuensis]|uniref:non-specific serine/threonine protein kinase n=1 Tax=Nocardioides taihuensis TaxID=1835606 RepID=A0ABW0BME2_9ACTN
MGVTTDRVAGRYSPVREIGRGGMGSVWLARDELLGREVALKRIGQGIDTIDLQRAEREARLAARLNHPHVVAVFDLVREGDQHWLVMEHVPGTTLADLVRDRGPLPPDEAAGLLVQAADALAAAHAAGIVHRDVKPSNMLVTTDGRVKLADFGIARAEADATLTQTGMVTGSPSYLAPEVASGVSASDTSDVWSWGAALYHALAGHPPYGASGGTGPENVMGTLYRIVHEDPPRLASAGWLAPVLEATMAKDPARRWSMAQVRDRLTDHEPEVGAGDTAPVVAPVAPVPPPTPVPAPAPAPRAAPPAPEPVDDETDRDEPRRRWPVVVAAVVVLLLTAALGTALALGGGDEDPAAGPTSDTTPSADRTGRTRSQEPSSSSAPTTPSPTPTPTPADGPSRAAMKEFVADYLATAASRPRAAYDMLTPGFQADSGGLSGYLGFWNTVADARLVSVSADPDALTVDYLVSYTLNGGEPRAPESVSLALDYRDGDYLIAAEA